MSDDARNECSIAFYQLCPSFDFQFLALAPQIRKGKKKLTGSEAKVSAC